MNLDKRQIEAHKKQAQAAEQTRQKILKSCTIEEIAQNKYLREALYGN